MFSKLKLKAKARKRLKVFRFDRDGKHTSNEFTIFCEEHGIMHQVIYLYLHQSIITKET